MGEVHIFFYSIPRLKTVPETYWRKPPPMGLVKEPIEGVIMEASSEKIEHEF